MNDIFALAAQNTVIGLILALLVYGLTRVWRNPPVAHLLWLLVLVKLVAPPIIHVEWSAFGLPSSPHMRGQAITDMLPAEGQEAESHTLFDWPIAQRTAQASATSATEHDFAAGLWRFWDRARPVLLWFWLGGAVLCASFPPRELCVLNISYETRCRRLLGCSDWRLNSRTSSASGGCPRCAMSTVLACRWFGVPVAARQSSCRCASPASSMTSRLE